MKDKTREQVITELEKLKAKRRPVMINIIKTMLKGLKARIAIMAILLGIACLSTYYFHAVLGTGTVFTHFFYIPIILAVLWWKRNGLFVAIFLVAVLILSHIFNRPDVLTQNDYFRALILIGVSLATVRLSERISKAEAAALRQMVDYNRHLIESSPDFQMTLDKDGKIMDVNEAFEEVVGKSRKDVIGTYIYEYFPKEMAEKFIAEIFEKKKVRDIEITARIPGKENIICNFSGTVFTTSEGGLGIYATGRDITERKRAEVEKEELEQKAQLASRLASIGKMASGMAHEINNPLTGVVGFSNLLGQREDLPDDVKAQLKIINTGANRITDIVKRMLTFPRQQKPERKLANINEVIETCLALRKYELETGNIKLIRHLNPDLPLTVVNAGQLQDVFMNIIVNAEKTMRQAHEGGKLSIRTKTVGDMIRISITDDGPGIAAKNMGKIFNPFFTTREVGEGTGLGLSLSYGIIQEHHGKIYAESELGKGATFIVELPIIAVAEGEERPVKSLKEVKTTTRAKILVIDDEPTILVLLREFLVREGHEVETVDNCQEALERARVNRCSLILCDVIMPGMSGAQLYHAVREEIPSLARRFIFITGDIIGEETRHFLSETGLPYVTKPFDLVEVKKVINQMLSGS